MAFLQSFEQSFAGTWLLTALLIFEIVSREAPLTRTLPGEGLAVGDDLADEKFVVGDGSADEDFAVGDGSADEELAVGDGSADEDCLLGSGDLLDGSDWPDNEEPVDAGSAGALLAVPTVASAVAWSGRPNKPWPFVTRTRCLYSVIGILTTLTTFRSAS